ncbi:aminotransferase class IV [Nannocystaceae bacterium ST9]
MPTKVWLSTQARPLDPEEATISVFDRGFLYGDSVYETLRTAGGRVVELDAHLARLGDSAEGIAFELPFEHAAIAKALEHTLAAAENPESRIRLIVTRGTGPIALDTRVAESPILVIIVQPLIVPTDDEYERGIPAVIVGDREGSVRPGLKTGNYLGNILALHRAHELGAEDAIMCNGGAVAEGATSNVFMIAGGEAHTPSLRTGLLAGITRQTVIGLLRDRLGIPVHERTITPDQLRAADEVFLTSSVRGVMPVTTLDGVVVGEGSRGPVTRRVIDAYAAYLDQVARGG